MSILDEVMGAIDGRTMQGMASAIGASPAQTQSAIQMALPAILGAMQRNTQTQQGAQALYGAVQRDHQGVDLGGLLGSVLGGGGQGGAGGLLGAVMGAMGGGQTSQSAQQPLEASGMGILKHVLGGSQQRAASGIANQSGLNVQSAMQLMAMLAPIVMAALGKIQAKQGTDAQGLAGVINQDMNRLGGGQPQDRGFLGGILDADGDGDVDAADLISRGSLLMGLFGKR